MKIVLDLDDTITEADPNTPYEEVQPKMGVIEKLREYKAMGFDIVICTGRQQRTYKGNMGKRNIYTLPVIIEWLKKYGVPYDEIWLDKPWEGHLGFRVDDKTVRPKEFRELTYHQIMELIEQDK